MPDEPLLTRYHIFEVVDPDAVNLKRVGLVDANDSAAALRKFLQHPPRDTDVNHVAISENSCKLRRGTARVTTKVEEVPWPALPGLEPEAPDDDEIPS